jgi:hypothetical protein
LKGWWDSIVQIVDQVVKPQVGNDQLVDQVMDVIGGIVG